MMLANTVRLLYRSLSLKFIGEDAEHTNDYDVAAATYDDYYSRHLSRSSLELMTRLPLKPGMALIDLACGTGFFSHRLAQAIGTQGKLMAVDVSSAMLAKNRDNAQSLNLDNIQFVQSDAVQFLRAQPSASIDGVVCGWGICYMDHAELRKEIERVVRPGGFLGIIENRSCTLATVSSLFEKALLQHPDAIVKNVVIKLPKDHRYLLKTFLKKTFRPVHAFDSRIDVPCRSGQEIADYMRKSGAAAGFIDALDKSRIDAVMAAFVREADRRRGIGKPVSVTHEWCMLVAARV